MVDHVQLIVKSLYPLLSLLKLVVYSYFLEVVIHNLKLIMQPNNLKIPLFDLKFEEFYFIISLFQRQLQFLESSEPIRLPRRLSFSIFPPFFIFLFTNKLQIIDLSLHWSEPSLPRVLLVA